MFIYRLRITLVWRISQQDTLELGVPTPHAFTNGNTEGGFISMLLVPRVEEM
jgi:hypothetical protein